MQQIIYVITGVVNYFIIILQFLMLARALLSWLPLGVDNQIANFLYMVTEPVVMPVRMNSGEIQMGQEYADCISFFCGDADSYINSGNTTAGYCLMTQNSIQLKKCISLNNYIFRNIKT